MKKTFIFLSLLLCAIYCHAQEEGNFIASDIQSQMKTGDKLAILVVHFGTTHDDTRAMTLDAINAKVKSTFPDLGFAEAYSSRIITRRLAARGIQKLQPIDALLKLRSEGYTHIIVQGTTLTDAEEAKSLREDVEQVRPFFKEVRIGTPLLYTVDDMSNVLNIVSEHLLAKYPTQKKQATKHFIFVGHGTYTPSTAIYSQVDYMLRDKGLNQFHIGTIEGYPTMESMMHQLKASKVRSAVLVPFMVVAGDHAKNDIDVEWKEALEQEGFAVETNMEGLGQLPAIQDIYIEHIRYAMTHAQEGILQRKAAYAAGKEK